MNKPIPINLVVFFFMLFSASCTSSQKNEDMRSQGEGIEGVRKANLPGPYEYLNEALKQEIRTIEGSKWMVRNLDVDTFQNGDPIPHARTEEEWVAAGKNEQPAWCYFRNDSSLGKWFGKLYNGFAVHDPRGLAPRGFHISTEEEWENMLNGSVNRENVSTNMKAQNAWLPTMAPEGTNLSGFNGLPGGFRDKEGIFQTGETEKPQREILDFMGGWWVISGSSSAYPNPHVIRIWAEAGGIERCVVDMQIGSSVRCVANGNKEVSYDQVK